MARIEAAEKAAAAVAAAASEVAASAAVEAATVAAAEAATRTVEKEKAEQRSRACRMLGEMERRRCHRRKSLAFGRWGRVASAAVAKVRTAAEVTAAMDAVETEAALSAKRISVAERATALAESEARKYRKDAASALRQITVMEETVEVMRDNFQREKEEESQRMVAHLKHKTAWCMCHQELVETVRGRHEAWLHGGRAATDEHPAEGGGREEEEDCLLYTSPSPRDKRQSRMPSSA